MSINIGVFINTIINFIIVAFAMFLIVRNINRLRVQETAPPPAPTTKECSFCKSTIAIAAIRCAHCTSDLMAA